MDAIITPGKLNGTLTAPPSKSHSHRLLIGAYLTGDPACVEVPALSEDIAATKECLEALFGANTAEDTGSVLTLDCRESGSTLRFLLPIVAALPAFRTGQRQPLAADPARRQADPVPARRQTSQTAALPAAAGNGTARRFL